MVKENNNEKNIVRSNHQMRLVEMNAGAEPMEIVIDCQNEHIDVRKEMENAKYIVIGDTSVTFHADNVSAVLHDNCNVECLGAHNDIRMTGSASLLVIHDPCLTLRMEDKASATVRGAGSISCDGHGSVSSMGFFHIKTKQNSSPMLKCYGMSNIDLCGCASLEAYGECNVKISSSFSSTGNTIPVVLHDNCLIDLSEYRQFDRRICRLFDNAGFKDEPMETVLSDESQQDAPEADWMYYITCHHHSCRYRLAGGSMPAKADRSRVSELFCLMRERAIRKAYDYITSLPKDGNWE